MAVSTRIAKPSGIFARDREWDLLTDHLVGGRVGSQLAVVLGRRRQGKSSLLEGAATATGGFYWEAAQQSREQNLAAFGEAWGLHIGSPAPLRFDDWAAALSIVFAQPSPLILIDEVGYLVETAPEFPSLLQRYFGPKEERTGTARVVLCGSVIAQMTKLLAVNAPLRGRQHLVIDVEPFDFRSAGEFWGLSGNPDAAFRMHALIGGTSAYRRFAGGHAPERGNIDKWAIRYLLDPSSPLFHEGQLLVADDPTLVDKSLYWAVLGAVADGNSSRGAIAKAVGRTSPALTQSLDVLAAGRWIEQRRDPFRDRSTTIALTDPMIRSYRTLIAPERPRLAAGRAAEVWSDAQPKIARRIFAPHLEWMANDWLIRFASPDTAGGAARSSTPGVLRPRTQAWQIDIVALAPDRNDVDRVIAIGEVKATREAVGLQELARLDEIANALGDRGAAIVRRVLVGRAGFTAELQREARRRGDVELVDLDRLYGGS
jgi:uncharacterized protein